MESFYDLRGEDQYLLGFVFPYLENLHSSRYDVPTFVEHNPFGRIRCTDQNNPRLFKMLFVKCSRTYNPLFVIVWNWNWSKKYLIKCSSSKNIVWISQNFPFDKIYWKYLILLLECCLYFLSLRHLVLAWWALGWTLHSYHHVVVANCFPTSP